MRRFSFVLVVLMIAGCGGGGGDKAESTGEAAQATTEAEPVAEAAQTEPVPAGPVELATRSVACGCAIDDIGVCGDYVEIDGKYVKLANYADLGLGSMEWCGKDGVTAETAGEIKDGEFVATTLNVTLTE